MRFLKMSLLAFVLCASAFAAADLELKGKFGYVLNVSTSSVSVVALPGQSVLIKHMGKKTDGTDSGASDYITIQLSSATSDPTLGEGTKLVIKPGEAYRFTSENIPSTTDGRTIQIKATTGSAKVQFLMGG